MAGIRARPAWTRPAQERLRSGPECRVTVVAQRSVGQTPRCRFARLAPPSHPLSAGLAGRPGPERLEEPSEQTGLRLSED